MQFATKMVLALSLVACGTVESRTLELKGPDKVTVRAFGPVQGPPVAVLSDGSPPEGAEVAVTPEGVVELAGDRVVARARGEAVVSTTWNGQSVSWTVVVSPPLQLSLQNVPATMAVDQTVTAAVAASSGGKPADAAGATWSSSKAEVLEVSPTGELRGVSAGIAYVVVKLGESEAMAEVRVSAPE